MELDRFLQLYEDVLLHKHRRQLYRFREKLAHYKNQEPQLSRHGFHYTSCCWALDNTVEGPDTCECDNVEQNKKDAKKLIDLYLRICNVF